jgi:lipoate-protein ligase A
MDWRLIDTDIANPYFVTAADEAIYQARKDNKIENTLHFYRRNPSAVSVGRSRKLHDDIHIKNCEKYNVKIIRRTTGGGTIFTDKHCLIYSLVFINESTKLYSPLETFKIVCHSIINALSNLDIKTVYKPPNDILLNGKKISGSAQIQKDNITLIHGTLLLDSNLELMKKVLKNSTNSYVSTLCKEIGYVPSLKIIKNDMKKSFESYFNIKFKKDQLSAYENTLIKRLLKKRYLNKSWNFKR